VNDLESIRGWFAFNAHVRRAYLEGLVKLPREELVRDRGASYPTLLGIIEHSGWAYSSWIVRASKGDPHLPQVGSGPDPGPGSDPSLDEMRRFEDEVQSLVRRFLEGLVEADLDRTFLVAQELPWFPTGYTLSVRDMLWHLVEEDLQHRGELNALLWQIDIDPPLFDWIDWVQRPRAAPTGGR
jgi:uncharacterized damage-inducible protein DinB